MGEITLNGEPIGSVIGRESGKELHEAVEVKVPRRPSISRHRGNHSGSKTFQGITIYKADQKAQKVLIRGSVFDWKVKAPYVKSGHSILGGIEVTEDENEACCHECGQWFSGLADHVKVHGLTARDYRIRHGIQLDARINSPIHSENRRKQLAPNLPPMPKRLINLRRLPRKQLENLVKDVKAQVFKKRRIYTKTTSPDLDNLRMNCEAQRIATLQAYANKLGRTPTCRELDAYTSVDHKGRVRHPLCCESLEELFGVKLRQILIRAGLKPRLKSEWINPELRGKHIRKDATTGQFLPSCPA